MEEQEPCASAGRLTVEPVDRVDRGDGGRQDLVVTSDVLRVCVEPVREQREPDVTVAVGQVMDLEIGDLSLDVALIGEERRYDDQGPH